MGDDSVKAAHEGSLPPGCRPSGHTCRTRLRKELFCEGSSSPLGVGIVVPHAQRLLAGLAPQTTRAQQGTVGARALSEGTPAERQPSLCFSQDQTRDYPRKVIELSLRREKWKFMVLS